MRDLLLCAKHLFVEAKVAWVRPEPAAYWQFSGAMPGAIISGGKGDAESKTFILSQLPAWAKKAPRT